MNCNGKMYPYKKDVTFDIVLFGNNQNGKVKVVSYHDKERNTWRMKKAKLYTKKDVVTLL
mgnify:CR=1 FL=1